MNLNYNYLLVFTLLGTLGSAAILPYSAALNSSLDLTPKIVGLSILQGAVLAAIASAVGLLASHSLGLKVLTPIPHLWLPVLLGAAAAALILILEIYLYVPRLPEALTNMGTNAEVGTIALWKRLLAGFYGGINEELLMRFFLLSGSLWLVTRIWHAPSGAPLLTTFWIVNILVAIIFGLGHLPAMKGIAELTPLIISRTILLNSVAGIVFGWIFWHYGLVAAMASHFAADMVLHVVFPLISSGQ